MIPTFISTHKKGVHLLRLFSLIVIGITSIDVCEAQLWKRHRGEIFFSGGASQMLGDLGGGTGVGQNSLADLNLEATNFVFSTGFKYRVTPEVTARLGLSWARVSASDEFSQDNQGRRNRNLSVRTDVIELSPMLEFYIIKDKLPLNLSLGRRYRRHGQGASFSLYVATGFTMFYYNPQAQLGNTWHNLRPLSTEGQGIAPASGLYSEFSFALPVGLGFKLNLTRDWSIGVEGQARFTATDYLDDVSTTYYDNEAIANARGPVAAELADRRIENSGGAGGIRGNPDNNDVYFMLQFNVVKRIQMMKRRRPVRRRF